MRLLEPQHKYKVFAFSVPLSEMYMEMWQRGRPRTKCGLQARLVRLTQFVFLFLTSCQHLKIEKFEA